MTGNITPWDIYIALAYRQIGQHAPHIVAVFHDPTADESSEGGTAGSYTIMVRMALATTLIPNRFFDNDCLLRWTKIGIVPTGCIRAATDAFYEVERVLETDVFLSTFLNTLVDESILRERVSQAKDGQGFSDGEKARLKRAIEEGIIHTPAS